MVLVLVVVGGVEMCSVEVALIIAGTLDHSQYWHLRIVTKGRGKRKMPCISPSILEFKKKEKRKSRFQPFTSSRALGPLLCGLYVWRNRQQTYNECESSKSAKETNVLSTCRACYEAHVSRKSTMRNTSQGFNPAIPSSRALGPHVCGLYGHWIKLGRSYRHPM